MYKIIKGIEISQCKYLQNQINPLSALPRASLGEQWRPCVPMPRTSLGVISSSIFYYKMGEYWFGNSTEYYYSGFPLTRTAFVWKTLRNFFFMNFIHPSDRENIASEFCHSAMAAPQRFRPCLSTSQALLEVLNDADSNDEDLYDGNEPEYEDLDLELDLDQLSFSEIITMTVMMNKDLQTLDPGLGLDLDLPLVGILLL